MKEKGERLYAIKIKNFCSAKGIIKRMKRQPTYWGETFAQCISARGLVPRINKEPLRSNNRKTNKLIRRNRKKTGTDFSSEKMYAPQINTRGALLHVSLGTWNLEQQ